MHQVQVQVPARRPGTFINHGALGKAFWATRKNVAFQMQPASTTAIDRAAVDMQSALQPAPRAAPVGREWGMGVRGGGNMALVVETVRSGPGRAGPRRAAPVTAGLETTETGTVQEQRPTGAARTGAAALCSDSK